MDFPFTPEVYYLEHEVEKLRGEWGKVEIS